MLVAPFTHRISLAAFSSLLAFLFSFISRPILQKQCPVAIIDFGLATQLQWQYVIRHGKPKKIRAKPIGFLYFPYSHETATNKPWLYLKTRNHKHPTPKAQSLKPKLFSIKPYTHTTTTIQTVHTFIYFT